MSATTTSATRVEFGLYVADLRSGELWKGTYRVKLQSQAFKVLTVLLERAGDVVTRDDLQEAVWGAEVNVDLEHATAGAIKKIREAIGDSADNPRFVQTLPKRGYRFIAPVRYLPTPSGGPEPFDMPAAPVAEIALPAPMTPTLVPEQIHKKIPLKPWITGVGILLLTSLVFLMVKPLIFRNSESNDRISQVSFDDRAFPSKSRSYEQLSALLTEDQNRLYTLMASHGLAVLSEMTVSSGQSKPLQLPTELISSEPDDISPDGSRLLVRSQPTLGLQADEQPVWIVPTNGSSAFRVPNVLAHASAWASDGEHIFYARGQAIELASTQAATARHIANLPGRAFWLRVSPDKRFLRMTLIDFKASTSSLWQVDLSSGKAEPLLPDWHVGSRTCCGIWTADAKSYVFQAELDSHSDLWVLREGSNRPVRLTNGPLEYEAPASGREGDRIFFRGRQSRVLWQTATVGQGAKNLEVRSDFLSQAARISYSRDKQWVAWTDVMGKLWRAKVDGSERLQLTPSSLNVLNAAWSPDGRQLAFMGREQDKPWNVYLVSAEGGAPAAFTSGSQSGVGDPTFSPDGRQILIGSLPYLMGGKPGRPLQIFDLESRKATEIPESAGFYSPRWSPDGRYIIALTLDQSCLMLYDMEAKKWRVLVISQISDPNWTSNSLSVLANRYTEAGEELIRVSVPSGSIDVVEHSPCLPAAVRCIVAGLDVDNQPMILNEVARSNIFTMRVGQH